MNEYQTWHAELLRETRIFMNGSLLTSLVKFMLCKTVAVIKVGQGHSGSEVISLKDPHTYNMGKGGNRWEVLFFVILCYFYPGEVFNTQSYIQAMYAIRLQQQCLKKEN